MRPDENYFGPVLGANVSQMGRVSLRGSVVRFEGTCGVATFDLLDAAAACARQPEVAFVNYDKAPELLSALNRGYSLLGEAVAFLQSAARQAKTAVERRRAYMLTVGVPQVLAAALAAGKELPNVKEIREAVVARDQQIEQEQDTLEALTALAELLKVRRDSLRDSFSAVKALVGNVQLRSSLPSGGAGEAPVGQGQARQTGLGAWPLKKPDEVRPSCGGFGSAPPTLR